MDVMKCMQPCRLPGNSPPFLMSLCGRTSLRPVRFIATRAGDGGDGPGPSNTPGLESKEATLERLEASIRGKATAPRPSGPNKPIPIRGVTQQQRKIDSQYENMAEWREGQLFPDGWESMNFGQKVSELYLGRRGVLFWANKAAYASVFVLLGGWILFRFIGPALGLYRLSGELQPPPM